MEDDFEINVNPFAARLYLSLVRKSIIMTILETIFCSSSKYAVFYEMISN